MASDPHSHAAGSGEKQVPSSILACFPAEPLRFTQAMTKMLQEAVSQLLSLFT
jgi:hypothetical protein